MDKLLTHWYKQKKDKHGKHCHEQWKKYLFVFSVDFMLGKEALVILTTFSRLMAEKLKKSISHVRGWVNS